MTAVISKPGTVDKLRILSDDAQYDLACACATGKDEHRKRGAGGKWIYPVTLPNGGVSVLLKTLVSNHCNNDCKYCPLRENMDIRRCSLSVDETVRVFLDNYTSGKVSGLFLSSGMVGNPDRTMEKMTSAVEILRRKHKFKGYVHLKIIPGSSNAAIEKAVSVASAVSLNIETPGEDNLKRISNKKDFIKDIVEPIKLISRLTGKGQRYSRVKQTTQFIVGAAGEKDNDIVKYMGGLYGRMGLHRIYFSAYQKGLGDSDIPGEQLETTNESDIFMREHRLYQVDFLMRKYGFKAGEIGYDENGNLRLDKDPKQTWADNHPEMFPLNINRASKEELFEGSRSWTDHSEQDIKGSETIQNKKFESGGKSK